MEYFNYAVIQSTRTSPKSLFQIRIITPSIMLEGVRVFFVFCCLFVFSEKVFVPVKEQSGRKAVVMVWVCTPLLNIF